MDINEYKELAYKKVLEEFESELKDLKEEKDRLEIEKYKNNIMYDLYFSIGDNTAEVYNDKKNKLQIEINKIKNDILNQEVKIDKLEQIERRYVIKSQ